MKTQQIYQLRLSIDPRGLTKHQSNPLFYPGLDHCLPAQSKPFHIQGPHTAAGSFGRHVFIYHTAYRLRILLGIV